MFSLIKCQIIKFGKLYLNLLYKIILKIDIVCEFNRTEVISNIKKNKFFYFLIINHSNPAILSIFFLTNH